MLNYCDEVKNVNKFAAAAGYLNGILTAPFLAYGCSQVLAEFFPEEAAAIEIEKYFTVSPPFLVISILTVIFIFHSCVKSFYLFKLINFSEAANLYIDENAAGIKLKLIFWAVFALSGAAALSAANLYFFSGVMGSIGYAAMCTAVPAAIFFSEAYFAAFTIFKLKIKESITKQTVKID